MAWVLLPVFLAASAAAAWLSIAIGRRL